MCKHTRSTVTPYPSLWKVTCKRCNKERYMQRNSIKQPDNLWFDPIKDNRVRRGFTPHNLVASERIAAIVSVRGTMTSAAAAELFGVARCTIHKYWHEAKING